MILRVVRSFRTHSDVFGFVRMHSDAFGCIRKHLDALGCVGTRLENFGNFGPKNEIFMFLDDLSREFPAEVPSPTLFGQAKRRRTHPKSIGGRRSISLILSNGKE